MENNKLSIDPYNPSYGHIIWKSMIGFGVWIVVAFLVFAITVLFNTLIQKSLWTISSTGAVTGGIAGSPALAIVILFIGFVVSFLGNTMITLIYGIAFSEKYYNTSKWIGHIIFANLVLLISMAPIYFVYSGDISSLFMILWFHIVLALFISHNIIETIANPNYTNSALMWNTAWMVLFGTLFLLFYKIVTTGPNGASIKIQNDQIKILLSVPAILCYMVIPFASVVWEKIYYGLYTLGTNFLYTPSLDEVTVDSNSNESHTVVNDNSNDINVDIG